MKPVSIQLLVSEAQECWLGDLYPLFMPFDTYPKGLLATLKELDDKFRGAGFKEQHAAVSLKRDQGPFFMLQHLFRYSLARWRS